MKAETLPLACHRILVTRPEGQAQALLAAIEQQGGTAWHFPLLRISALSEGASVQACKQRFMALDQYQQLIFVSTNAVRFGREWIDSYWPQLPVGIRWHGIGGGTCRAMIDAGMPVDAAFDDDHPMNSEALLESPALQSLTSQRVLIVRGVGGREHLQQRLVERGARVDIAECYQRSVPAGSGAALLQLINRQHIGTICINSGDSLSNLCDLLGTQVAEVRDMRLVVPSQRVAQLATDAGFRRVTTAANASDKAVLAALQNLQ